MEATLSPGALGHLGLQISQAPAGKVNMGLEVVPVCENTVQA